MTNIICRGKHSWAKVLLWDIKNISSMVAWIVSCRFCVQKLYANCYFPKPIYSMDVNFNPKTPDIIKKIKNNFNKLLGSLKNKMPTITAPILPIPVQIE